MYTAKVILESSLISTQSVVTKLSKSLFCLQEFHIVMDDYQLAKFRNHITQIMWWLKLNTKNLSKMQKKLCKGTANLSLIIVTYTVRFQVEWQKRCNANSLIQYIRTSSSSIITTEQMLWKATELKMHLIFDFASANLNTHKSCNPSPHRLVF
jgi:hypothetical protein